MSSSINLTPTFVGASWYGVPKGKQLHFRWVDVPVEFVIPPGTYTPPLGDSIPFSYALLSTEIHPVGQVFTEFGVARLPQDKNVYPVPITSNLFGTGFIRLQYRYVNAVGWTVTPFGTAYVYNRNRWVYAASTTNTIRWGTAIVQNRDVHPIGWTESSKFGWPNIYNKTRKIYPLWQASESFGVVRVNNAKFEVPGWVATQFGLSFIENKLKRILPAGFIGSQWGSAWVSNAKRFVYHQQSSSAMAFGNVTHVHKWITPKGVTYQLFGTSKVQAKNQFIYATGFMQKLFSNKTAVTYKNQPRQMEGFDAQLFGVGVLSPRYIKPAGEVMSLFSIFNRVGGTRITNVTINNYALFGSYFVAHTPRYVYHAGQVFTLFGAPPYGVMHKFDQNVEPSGEVLSQWGREAWDYRVAMFIKEIDYAREVKVPEMSSFGTPGVSQ